VRVTVRFVHDWDLLVVGDANPDLVLRGDVVPRFGQVEQWLTAADLVLAGSAGIVAAGAARLGLRTAIAAHVGCDLFGDVVLSRLTERGVDVSLVAREPALPTGLSVILSSPEDRSILTLPGAISRQRADEVPDEVLARVRHLHVAGFFLVPELAQGTAELFRRARAAGVSTSLDTNWDPANRWAGVDDVLPHTDVFLPNATELRALTGHDDLDRAAAAVRALGPVLAVKAGADGALGWDAAGAYRAPAAAVDVVDTTGAGDSFVAGFLAARLAGHPFATCLSWAACAGSLSTRAAGGTGAQATAAELAAAAG
jgi:ribokinase